MGTSNNAMPLVSPNGQKIRKKKKKGRKNNEIGRKRPVLRVRRWILFSPLHHTFPSLFLWLIFYFLYFFKTYADDRLGPSSGPWTPLKPDSGVYQSWLWPTSNVGPGSMVSMKIVLLPGIIGMHPTTGPTGCCMYLCIAGRLVGPYSCPRLGFVSIICRRWYASARSLGGLFTLRDLTTFVAWPPLDSDCWRVAPRWPEFTPFFWCWSLR